MLEQTIEINLLYDFYGVLLTNKQCKLLELYYQDNLSLGEIAESQETTRQAVFEVIKRAEAKMKLYELKLALVRKHEERKKYIKELCPYIEYSKEAKKLLEEIISLD